MSTDQEFLARMLKRNREDATKVPYNAHVLAYVAYRLRKEWSEERAKGFGIHKESK